MARSTKAKPTGKLRLEWRLARDLRENPANWRRHPEAQMSAIKELIADPEIGWAGVCLYNEKTGRLIDGHARKAAVDPDTPHKDLWLLQEGNRRK